MLNRFLITAPFFVLLVASPQGASLAADAKAGEALASQVCAACHGPDGNSVAPTFPNLAGQAAGYTADQLNSIKSGQRAVPEMAAFVANLSSNDMQNLGAYYAAQTARQGSIPETDVEAAERGGASLSRRRWIHGYRRMHKLPRPQRARRTADLSAGGGPTSGLPE